MFRTATLLGLAASICASGPQIFCQWALKASAVASIAAGSHRVIPGDLACLPKLRPAAVASAAVCSHLCCGVIRRSAIKTRWNIERTFLSVATGRSRMRTCSCARKGSPPPLFVALPLLVLLLATCFVHARGCSTPPASAAPLRLGLAPSIPPTCVFNAKSALLLSGPRGSDTARCGPVAGKHGPWASLTQCVSGPSPERATSSKTMSRWAAARGGKYWGEASPWLRQT